MVAQSRRSRCAYVAAVLIAATAALTTVTGTARLVEAQGAAAPPRVTPQTSGVTSLLQAAHAVDDRVVWASGHRGAVIRTRDGGTTWERLSLPSGDTLEFRDVHAISADVAWVLSAGSGRSSRIYHTRDGGRTWTMQFVNTDTAAFYDCLAFFDTRRGVAFSDASNGRTNVLRTDDAGGTWKLLDASKVPSALPGEGAFASSGLCVATASQTLGFIATGSPGARLFRSTDAGATWTASETPFVRGAVAGLTGVAFRSATDGIAVAADINRLRTDTSSAVVGVTSDGGRTWTMRPRPPLPGAMSGVAWVPETTVGTAVVVGFGGAFYTRDAGRSWTTLNDRTFTGVAASGRTAWIVGAGGAVIRIDFSEMR